MTETEMRKEQHTQWAITATKKKFLQIRIILRILTLFCKVIIISMKLLRIVIVQQTFQ